MKISINRNEGLLILFSIYCFICFQFTEIKIYNIKLSELLSLSILPFIYYKFSSINKFLFYFLIFFTLLLISTFLINFNQDFYLDPEFLTFLKRPYLISISRYIEYLACFSFATVTYKAVNYFISNGYDKNEILTKVIKVNAIFSVFLIFLYLLYFFNVLAYNQGTIVYNAAPYLPYPILRLKGFYFEGGPFGLFYAFLFCITTFINKKSLYFKIIFIIIILLAKSKAGIIAVIGWVFYRMYIKFRSNYFTKFVVFLILVPLFVLTATKVANNYIETYQQTAQLLKDRPNDTNFIMGRTAALYIVPNMVKHNPLFGIGLGNYSLVRNDPRYLGILPVVTDWDLPGLGGVVSLLIENGFLGLIGFLYLIFLIYKKYSSNSLISQKCIILFLIICCFGVQLYFLYIWFLIGLAVTNNDTSNEDLNERTLSTNFDY